jgi:phosphate-selective porin OprO/OprP
MVILRNKRRTLLLGGALALMAAPALAQTEPRLDRLQQELDALRAQLSDLRQAQGNLDNSAALTDLKRATGDQYIDLAGRIGALPKVGLDNGRLTVASADGDFTFALRGLIQYDIGYFAQGRNGTVPDLSSGTNFRRAQVGFTGTAFRDWAYNLTFDFAGNGIEKSGYIYNAYLEYDGLKPFALRIGAYTPPTGLEDQTGSGDLLFLERASAVDAARNIAGAPSRQAVTLFLREADYFAALSYTGQKVGDGAAFDEQQAVIGRIAWLPVNTPDFKWLLDADATWLFKPTDIVAGTVPRTTPLHAVALSGGPELAVDNNGPKTVNTGAIDADSVTEFGAETAAEYDALYLQGGWFHYDFQRRNPALPDPGFNGWYALATWSLTGETHAYDPSTASFRGLRPLHGLGSGGFGAWELKARYSFLDLDDDPLTGSAAGGIAGGKQTVWTVGANWYPTNGIRFTLEYSNLHVRHVNAPAGNISADEFGLRTQLSL